MLSHVKSTLESKIDFITKNDSSFDEFLSFGQLFDYYNQFKVEDEQGFNICYNLVYSTSGDPNDINDVEFNELRDEFFKTFGEYVSKKVGAYSMIKNEIKWEIGVSEEKLSEFRSF